MEKENTVKTLEQLKKLLKPVRNVNVEHKKKLKWMDKLAIWITTHVGTLGFFFVLFTWTTLWLLWNASAPDQYRFDSFPGFVLWLFISQMIQLFLMPLIMVGQNLQGQYSEIRAEADYEVNLKAEIEIETILLHLENQTKLILEISKRMEKQEKKN